MFPKVCILRRVFYNNVTLSTDNTILHLIKKFVFCPIQRIHYTTDVSNTVYLRAKEKNNNKNLSVCLNTQNLHDEILTNKISSRYNQWYTNIYLVNSEIAKKFVTLIKDDLFKNMKHVIELNPGFGILTKELLLAGVPLIHLYESNVMHQEHLIKLCTEFPNQVSLNISNPCKVTRLLSYITINDDNNNDDKSLSNIQKEKWEGESCLQIIGTITNSAMIRHLIASTVFQTNIMMYGRPIFYLAMPTSVYKKATHPEKATASYIMFNILFNFQIFGTLDRKAFMPQLQKKSMRSTKSLMDNDSLLIVIKLEPKSDLFTLFKSKENLIYFWHFVRHNFYRKSTRVIPALEKVIPGCGVKLIAQNYNIFTQFSDLTPTQAINLFFELQSWSEYEQSTFILSANDIKNLYDSYVEE